jgi:hypothetical protein
LWIIPLIDWQIYKILNHITTTYFAAHTYIFSFKNFLDVVRKEILELVNIKSWNLLWIIYFYTLFLGFIKRNKGMFELHTIIISQLVIYTCLYLFTAGNSPESSFERLLVHIAPLALLTVAFSLKDYLTFHEDKTKNKFVIVYNKFLYWGKKLLD